MLQTDIREGRFSDTIVVNIDRDAVRPPTADCRKRQIQMNESYIAYLWATTYCFFVLQDHIQLRLDARTWTGHLDLTVPLVRRAADLFSWAMSLADVFSSWDLHLPNPDTEHSRHLEEEVPWIERTNNLFLDAMSYVMYHEYSHIVLGHCETYANIQQKTTLGPEDEATLTQIEAEADNYAFDVLVREDDDESVKFSRAVAIVYVHVASLFLLNSPHSIVQRHHPDIDSRLCNVIERLSLSDARNSFYVKALVCTAAKLFFNHHGIEVPQQPAGNIDEILHTFLSVFDTLK